jgi:ABC-type branched-subunit amino acid transport system substrate-binding protein
MITQLRNLVLVLLCVLVGYMILSAWNASSARSAIARAQAASPAGKTKPTLALLRAGQTKPTLAVLRAGQMKPAPGLSPEEKLGKAFYLRGESSSGQEITAMIGELDVPASTVTCASCHGVRGEGKTEGGVTAGNLTWSFLTKPFGHTHPTGRKHPAFSEASFIRAMNTGIDPAGNKMLAAMPLYRMPQQDLANLIAYLKRIELDTDPGVTESSIVIGTLLPESAAFASTGKAMEDVLQAYFTDINSRGGIYNRKIELRVVRGPTSDSAANMKRLVDDEQVFAIVGGITAGADDTVAALSREKGVPFIGPSTLLPQRGLPLNRYLFYLTPGLKEQARALVNHAAKKTVPAKARVAVVSPDTDLNNQLVAAIQEQGKRVGWQPATQFVYAREKFDATQSVTQLKQQRVDTVFLLGSGIDVAAFFKAAEAANWTPAVYLLGALTGRDITAIVPLNMKDSVFLSFPTVPTDISYQGRTEFTALLEKYKLGATHTAAQVAALAAAKIFVEALKRAGRDLSREVLVTALESLYDYDTGLTPRITFGPSRRVGSLGAYVVTIDPEKKTFRANTEWIAAE